LKFFCTSSLLFPPWEILVKLMFAKKLAGQKFLPCTGRPAGQKNKFILQVRAALPCDGLCSAKQHVV
jgi:hypothetical protein